MNSIPLIGWCADCRRKQPLDYFADGTISNPLCIWCWGDFELLTAAELHARLLAESAEAHAQAMVRAFAEASGSSAATGQRLPDDGRLWDADDVATFFKASRSWVYQQAEAGELPCVRIRGVLRFEPTAIRAFASGTKSGAPLRRLK